MEKSEKSSEPAAVAAVRAAIVLFTPARRAFAKRAARAGEVAAIPGAVRHFVVLLESGRWTTSADVDDFDVVPHGRHSLHEYRGGRWVKRAAIDPYLDALVALGVLTVAEVETFRAWRHAGWDREHNRKRLEQLAEEVAALGGVVTVGGRQVGKVVKPRAKRGAA